MLLTDYRLERQYEAFSIDDMMNYSVNIYDEGRVLSIVVNAGARMLIPNACALPYRLCILYHFVMYYMCILVYPINNQ